MIVNFGYCIFRRADNLIIFNCSTHCCFNLSRPRVVSRVLQAEHKDKHFYSLYHHSITTWDMLSGDTSQLHVAWSSSQWTSAKTARRMSSVVTLVTLTKDTECDVWRGRTWTPWRYTLHTLPLHSLTSLLSVALGQRVKVAKSEVEMSDHLYNGYA